MRAPAADVDFLGGYLLAQGVPLVFQVLVMVVGAALVSGRAGAARKYLWAAVGTWITGSVVGLALNVAGLAQMRGGAGAAAMGTWSAIAGVVSLVFWAVGFGLMVAAVAHGRPPAVPPVGPVPPYGGQPTWPPAR